MGDKVRGTVTPLSESISVQDAENVAKKVAEAIEAQMKQLNTLQGYADENQSLHKLLLELPDLVSYNIMVLLGEGYYAERSAKQAAEILKRRSEFITTKIDSLKNQIKDLEAEAAFAKETAAEAAGGLVEIREEYIEPALQPAIETTKTNDTANTTVQDEKETDSDIEHARIMAKLNELELAEAAAGDDDDDDEEEEEEGEDYEEDEEMETNLRAAFRKSLLGDSYEDEDEEEEEEEEEEELDLDDRTAANTILNKSAMRLSEIDEEDSGEEFQSSIITSQHGAQSVGAQSSTGPSEQRRVRFSKTENIANPPSPEPLPPRDVKASAAQRAFTGSVVERNTELLPLVAPAAPETPPSRPVSKFKQRKG